MSIDSVLRTLACVLLAVALAGCGGASGPGPGDRDVQGDGTIGRETVFLWLSAWEDAFVVSSLSNNNVNYGNTSELLMGRTNASRSEIYVRFELPTLPAGSAVEEAYLQLYTADDLLGHPGQIATLALAEPGPWQVDALTWLNRPPATSLPNTMQVSPFDWARSDDMASLVQRHLERPNTNEGFVLTSDLLAAPVPAIELISLGNDRTPSMLGNGYRGLDVSAAPRLLMRVQLPEGADANDVLPPPTHNPADPLGRGIGSGSFPAPPRMLIDAGSDWPADWAVR